MSGRAGAVLSPTAFLSKYDPRRFGAVAHLPTDDGTTQTNKAAQNAVAFQTALDLAYAEVDQNGRIAVPVPHDRYGYRIGKPLIFQGRSDLYGTQPGSPAAILSTMSAFPAILFLRKVSGWDTSHFIDAYGTLDTSAVASAGARWAPKLNGDSYISFKASAAEFGPTLTSGNTKQPGWFRNLGKMTIEFCVHRTTGTWPSGEYFGSKAYDGLPDPFTLSYNPGSNRYDFNFMDNGGDYNGFWFNCAASATTHRLIIVIDFDGAAIQAYTGADGPAVAVTTNLVMGPSWTAGVRLREPGTGQFSIASNYGGAIGGETGKDLAIFGLKFSKTNQYAASATAGATPVRTDGATYNDANSYTTFRSNDYFMMRLPTTQTGNDALIRWDGNNGYGYGWMIKTALFGDSEYTGLDKLSWIKFGMEGNLYYSSLLMQVLSYDVDIDHCDFGGGARAIDQEWFNINYTTRVNKARFLGQTDANINLSTHLFYGDDFFLQSNSRLSLRFYKSNFDIRRIFGANTTAEGFADIYDCGANSILSWSGTDLESFHPDHGIRISKSSSTGGVSSIIFENTACGGISDGNYPVKVMSNGDGLNREPAVMTFRNSFNRYNKPGWPAIVGTDGSQWVVNIQGPHGTLGDGAGQKPYAADLYHDGRTPIVVTDGSAAWPAPNIITDPSFDISALSGFVGDYRADSFDGVLSDLDPVTSWASTGTSPFAALAYTGTGDIVYHAGGVGGYSYLQFPGTAYFQAPSGTSVASNDLSVIFVVQGSPDGGLWNSSPQAFGVGLRAQSGWTINGGTNVSRSFTFTNTTTSGYVYLMGFRIVSGVIEKWVGLAKRGPRAKYSGTAALGRFTLGGNASGQFFSGKLYRAVVIADAVSLDDYKLAVQQVGHDTGMID